MTWKAVAGVEGRYWRSKQDAVVMQGGAFTVRDAVDTSGWSLIPYVRRADSDCIARFEQFAEVLFDWPVGSFRPRMASASERRLAVTRHRVKLAKAYKYAIGDKNLTSLALWSGPDSIERAGAITIVPELEPAPTAKVAWLGTGDTYLRDGTDIDAFQHHYGDRLGNVSTFVLPHHGSIHNSDPYRLPSDADLWVACAEPIHKDWEHPASELVKAVVDRGKCFWPVKRARATGLDEQILIFWRP
jgi:hypothetical protein